jgi:hypothetical protein
MKNLRFGLGKLPDKGHFTAGIQSKFGLEPEEPKTIEAAPVIAGGFLYTIDKRQTGYGEMTTYDFYFLEYNSLTGVFIRESLIPDLSVYTRDLLLVGAEDALHIIDTNWWSIHKYDRETLQPIDVLDFSGGLFNYPGWPHDCWLSSPLMMTSDTDHLYVLFESGGRDETGMGSYSYWDSALMKVRKSDLLIEVFVDGGWWNNWFYPIENAVIVGDYFILKESAKVFRKLRISDLSYIDSSPDMGYNIYRPFSDQVSLFFHTATYFLKINPETWAVLATVSVPPFSVIPSIVADEETVYVKLPTVLATYKKADFSFIKTLNAEVPNTSMRLALAISK